MERRKSTIGTLPATTFYHRKLTPSGGTRTLSVGRILPSDWLIVKIQVLKQDDRVCVLEFTKLD